MWHAENKLRTYVPLLYCTQVPKHTFPYEYTNKRIRARTYILVHLHMSTHTSYPATCRYWW